MLLLLGVLPAGVRAEPGAPQPPSTSCPEILLKWTIPLWVRMVHHSALLSIGRELFTYQWASALSTFKA